MADERRPPAWGLWNERLGEWFNPGTRRPFWTDREAARRAIPKACRQYPMGTWELRQVPLDEAEEYLPGHLVPPAGAPVAP